MSDTIFILDWDDTLFPTSGIRYSSVINLPLFVDTLHDFLNQCVDKGNTYILTLSRDNWVKKCVNEMSKINDKLLKTFDNIKIIEAEVYSKITDNRTEWKKLAVKDILNAQTTKIKRIISCGDLLFDFLAIVSNTTKKIKSVFFKFNQTPSGEQLLDELVKCNSTIKKILNYKAKNMLISVN